MTDDVKTAIARVRRWADTNRNRASPMDEHTVAYAVDVVCNACESQAQEIDAETMRAVKCEYEARHSRTEVRARETLIREAKQEIARLTERVKCFEASGGVAVHTRVFTEQARTEQVEAEILRLTEAVKAERQLTLEEAIEVCRSRIREISLERWGAAPDQQDELGRFVGRIQQIIDAITRALMRPREKNHD